MEQEVESDKSVGMTDTRQRAERLALQLTDSLIDTIERTEDELDALRDTVRNYREILGSSQASLMEAEIAVLTALVDLRMCRFRELGESMKRSQ